MFKMGHGEVNKTGNHTDFLQCLRRESSRHTYRSRCSVEYCIMIREHRMHLISVTNL